VERRISFNKFVALCGCQKAMVTIILSIPQRMFRTIDQNVDPLNLAAEFLGRPEPPFRTGLCFTRDVF